MVGPSRGSLYISYNVGTMPRQFKCIIHGSFSKHHDEIIRVRSIFEAAGIEILAPKAGELAMAPDGFARFPDEHAHDARLIELHYLHNLKHLGENGFSYFVNPEGYIGTSTAYELGIAQVTNTRCFFSSLLADHPAYIPYHSIWSPELLAEYIVTYQAMPQPQAKRNERRIHQLWQGLMAPGSVVATGAIIEHQPKKARQDKEILLVKTHKWGNRYSIVGGKVRRNERLAQALLREVKEETGLAGGLGAHICTFDQIQDSGYYRCGVQHIFVDNVVKVNQKQVVLNHEAQDYIWALPSEALRQLDIEPNARTTIQRYNDRQLQGV